jgi:hypothetical protein
LKIRGLWVDIREEHGAFCKVAGIKEFPNLIYTVRWTGGALGSTVDRGWRGHRARRCLAGGWHTGARAHRSSPAGRNRERGDTGNSMGCSPGRGRQRGGRVMEGNSGGGRCAGERLARAKREVEDRVRSGGAVRGCSRWLL